MFKRLIFSLYIFLTFYIEMLSAHNDCMNPYCTCVAPSTLVCNNFTRFEQLNFQRLNGFLFESVEIRPLNVLLDLNENLNFNGLRLNGRLTMSNLRSLSAFYNPFRQILYDKFNLAILDSNFKFVGGSGGNQQAENLILNECNFQSSAQNFNYIFSDLRIIEFTLSGILFEKMMCPIIFRNSRIFNFILINPFGAYGFQNLTGFFSDDVSYIVNTNIRQIDFDYSKSTNQLQKQWLDARSIMNPIFFEQLDRININSARRFSYIQEDTFKYLKNVRKLEFNRVNIKDLLTRNRRWLKNLNFNVPSFDIDNLKLDTSVTSKIFQLIIWIDNEWNFNEEKDICLFKNFPHDKLVFPFLLFSTPALPCTCTIYWLYKYFSKYQTVYNLNQNIVPFHCFQQSNWDNCRFEALFNKWCPNSEEDLIEDFTTLKPNIDVVSSSTSATYTNPQTFTQSTISLQTSVQTTLSSLAPTLTASTSSSVNTKTTTTIFSSAIPIKQKDEQNLGLAAFYITIILCILTFFMIIAIIILYCKLCRSSSNIAKSMSNQDIYI